MMEEPVAKKRRAKDRDGLHKRRGIWHYRLKVDGRWKEYSTRTTSYEEARIEKAKAERAQEDGRLPTDMAKWPFERAAEEWLAGRSKMVAIRTLQIDKERLVPLRKAFAGRRLEEIVTVPSVRSSVPSGARGPARRRPSARNQNPILT